RSTAVPKGSRVSADGAESGRPKPGEVERTEAAHRNAADRHAALVGASSAQRCRDRFGQNLSSPRTIPTVVPVAVVAAVGEEDNRGAGPEGVQSVEQLLCQVRGGGAAPSVQEYEERPARAGSFRHDEHVVQVAVQDAAVEL